MNKPKFFFAFLIILLNLNFALAQTEKPNQFEPSYEVILHVVVASNNPGDKTALPQNLSDVVKNLKKDYLYKNYNLAATFIERITTKGVIGHTGVLNQLDQTQQNKIYYSDWGLTGLSAGKNDDNKAVIEFQAFNFGAKVPILMTIKGSGDGNPVVSYENIGIRISRFNVPENTPTIVGSLATPQTDEFIFLILTVRPVA